MKLYLIKSHITYFLYLPPLLMLMIFSCSPEKENAEPWPAGVQVLDDRLELTVIAQDPDIVTPIGIAVDSRDRVYVLESHTHLEPKDYQGPEGDIIKIFEDFNDDGVFDSVAVFAEGIKEGMNMAFSPEGHLYVVTSMGVWAYYDRDADGVSEENEKLLGLTEPESVYPHAAILSITFSNDGLMYIGRGNTGGVAWTFEGHDGSRVSGYGDGGNIMRARWDGTELEEFSTGFWNPFDLKFDNYGRLMVADNDPDSRGPNRLVHAVKEGDYGYKSMFGGSGIHPYSAWNGELPGTLPYAVALGEAPSGLLNASLAHLPADYKDQMLCTIWEESTIVRIKMEEEGISVTGDTEVIISGGEDFRPVAFATDSKGNIYFTDWVIREYPNHGKGKIWKLKAKDKVETLEKRDLYGPFLTQESDPAFQASLNQNAGFEDQIQKLKSDDPFVVHQAVMALSQQKHREKLIEKAGNEDTDIRLGILFALKESGDKEVEYLAEKYLSDPDLRIRNMALIWIGSQQMTNKKDQLEKVLVSGETTTALFETYLETVKLLQPEFVSAYQNREEKSSKSLKRSLPENFISNIVSDSQKSTKIRAFALRYVDDLDAHEDLLLSFLKQKENPEIRLEAIRILYRYPHQKLAEQLLQMTLDKNNPELIRSEALFALSGQTLEDWPVIIPLIEDQQENVRIEAARILRSKVADDAVKIAFESKLGTIQNQEPLKQQLMLGLNQNLNHRPDPANEEAWQVLLAGKGDSDRGRRVFYSNTSLCSTCHAMDGRGGDLGPDLINVGKSKDRNQLISSILYPSAEISPEWQGWYIKQKDGKIHQGRQIDVGGNSIKLYTQAEGFIELRKDEIEEYGMIKESLMPEGLQQRMTDQDIRDLLAYLGANGENQRK